ncbi:PREDICTED: uncharacterized protein LOC101304246 [Fragaria vesca subsp. vesca]
MASEEKQIKDQMSYPILLAERVKSAVDDAESFKSECSEVGKQVDRLSQMLRTVVRLSTTTPFLYERPIRRIIAEVCKNLERALTLVRKCKRQSVLRRVVTITSATDFRKLSSLLDSSLGDMKWLLSIFDPDSAANGIVLSLPPIASNDPILAWVWSFIATIQMGKLEDRVEAAVELASLAQDNDRNKKIIVEEGGVIPLLKLLKEESSPEAQTAATTALYNLAGDQEKVRAIVDEDGVPIIVQVLRDSAMRAQTRAASLVARMAQHDSVAQDEFARANVIRPLVTLLSFESFLEDPKLQAGKQSIHSVLEINKEMEKGSQRRSYTNSFSSSSYTYSEGSSRGGHNHRKDRENEQPLVKLQMKINCAEALWMLARGSISNSRRITETKGLLCLAKLVEKEQGELQYNCLMTIMEIADAAESNADLRRAAFKTNSPAAKAVVDQLIRLVKEGNSPTLQVPAIKAIGSLARTFPARETWVIEPLVTQLGNKDIDVATEAAIALGKFACSDNFLRIQHSKTIVEFNAIPPLMRLLRGNENSKLHGLLLLCYLALHTDNTDALEPTRVLTALEGAVNPQHPELRELVQKAIYHLNLYHSGGHSQRFT